MNRHRPHSRDFGAEVILHFEDQGIASRNIGIETALSNKLNLLPQVALGRTRRLNN